MGFFPFQPSAGGAPSGPAGGDLSGSYPDPEVAGIQGTPVAVLPGLATDYLDGTGNWSVPAGGGGGGGINPPAGDIGGTALAPTVVSTHLTAALPIAQGGTGQITAQAALNALAAAVTSGQFLRGNGTNVLLAAIQAADVPTLNQSTTGNAATATNLAGGATVPAFLAPTVSGLTFAATILVNAALGNAFNITLTASTGTFGAPSNPVDGQVIRFRITQDGTGSRTVAWNAAYDFGTAGAPTLSTAAGKVDIVAFEYIASLSKWAFLGIAAGD